MNTRELVGLFPAAGRAARLGGLAGSKEILTLGTPAEDGPPVRVCENLLAAFRVAGCARVLVLRRAEKTDLELALGDGSRFRVALAYRVIAPTASVAETLDRAFDEIRDCDVALGFPDVLARPSSGLADAVARRRESGADVVLALYPTDRPHKCDMVELDAAGRVRRIEIKPATTDLLLTWLFATWGPRFSAFLHRGVRSAAPSGGRELALSDLLLDAIGAGMIVEAVSFPAGSHLDVGTPDDLARARAEF